MSRHLEDLLIEQQNSIGQKSRSGRKYSYKSGERGSGTVVDEYIYADETGKLYLRVERTDDKQFPQSHWKDGRWQPGKPKGPKIPYALPSLIDAVPDEPVFICEGEKDADNVGKLELVATCASEGAGKWTTDLNKWFAGRKTVFILEDNDDHGRSHARRVAEHLSSKVKEIRIVSLPSLAEGGDVSDWIAKAGGTPHEKRAKLLKLAKGAPLFDRRPTFRVEGGDIARLSDAVENALVKSKQPVLFRAGELLEPMYQTYPTSKGDKAKLAVLKRISVAKLSYMVNKHACRFEKWNGTKKAYVPINPPSDLMTVILEKGHGPFPQVRGIINTPTLRPDGSILRGEERHLDEKTRLWLEPDVGFKLPPIPDRPTKADAEAALALLRGVLAEFPFGSDQDRSVALSAIQTLVLRGAFDLAPAHLFTAPEAGTGKSFLVDLISTIASGQPCPCITLPADRDETEKRIGAIMLEGVPMISLDNCRTNIDSDVLCQLLTQPIVKIRILGKSEMPRCENLITVLATGNNINFVGDTARRGLTSYLDAQVENPAMRRFKARPIKTVTADRGAFVAASLTIARAFLASRAKVKCAPFGSFEEWSRFVREPLIWLGEADPVGSVERARQSDPERIEARTLIGEWKERLVIGEAYRVQQIIDKAKEREPDDARRSDPIFKHPEFYELLRTKCSAPNRHEIDPYRVGKWLERLKGQVIDGWRITLATKSASHGNRWRIEPVTARAKADPKLSQDQKKLDQRAKVGEMVAKRP